MNSPRLRPPAWINTRSECSRVRAGTRGAAAGLVEMREGTFEPFATQAQQPLATGAVNASPVPIDGGARLGFARPVASPAIWFRDVAADPHRFEIDQLRIAVIARVAADLLQAVPVRHHGLDVFRGGRQRGLARLRIACVSVLHGHADHCAGFEIDRVLGFVGQMRAPVLPLRDCRVGIVRMPPGVVRPFRRPLAINARQIGTGRRLDTGRLRELAHKALLHKTRFIWLKNPWNLTETQHRRLAELEHLNLKINRAYLLKELFAHFWSYRRAGWAKRVPDALVLVGHALTLVAHARLRVDAPPPRARHPQLLPHAHRQRYRRRPEQQGEAGHSQGLRIPTAKTYIRNLYHCLADLPLPQTVHTFV